MKSSTVEKKPLQLIEYDDWFQVGNSIGFHCLSCDTVIWTHRRLIGKYGKTLERRDCSHCNWRGQVRFEGMGT